MTRQIGSDTGCSSGECSRVVVGVSLREKVNGNSESGLLEDVSGV